MAIGEELRIGVCGIGSIGFRHARLLSRRSDVKLYLCDRNPTYLEEARSLAHVAETTEEFDKLLDIRLDGLVISTPDQFHVPQAQAACQKGIPVLLEKPVAETAHQGSVLRKYSRGPCARILVGYALRHNAVFLKAKELFDAELIGTPVSFSVMLGAYDTLVLAKDRFKPTEVNKLFLDYSHEWDYIQWFLGRVRRVVATSHESGDLERKQKPNVVDSLLELESEVTGTAHLDYVQSPGQRCFTIIGDRGTLAIDFLQGMVAVKIYHEEFYRTYRTVEHRDAMMERQLEHFIEVIRGDHEPRVTLEDGLNALRVADAMILSCAENSWQVISYDL